MQTIFLEIGPVLIENAAAVPTKNWLQSNLLGQQPQSIYLGFTPMWSCVSDSACPMTLTHLLNNGGGATTVEPKCGGCPIPLLRGHYVKKFLQTDAAETVPVEDFYAAGSQLTGLWSSRVKRSPPPPVTPSALAVCHEQQ
ncbi:unnamed protein product [Boreogadus saida]